MEITSRQIDNFWNKVDIKSDSECWKWAGCKIPGGYGYFKLGRKMQGAHRASWLINCGSIPGGLFVLHKCDNPPCVNPRHLWLGTAKDNTRDMFDKNRSYDRRGGNNPRAKLMEKQVKEIRELYETKRYSYQDLANTFKVSKGVISHIFNKRSWNYI